MRASNPVRHSSTTVRGTRDAARPSPPAALAPNFGVKPSGNVDETLTVEHRNDPDFSLSPVSGYDHSSANDLSSSENFGASNNASPHNFGDDHFGQDNLELGRDDNDESSIWKFTLNIEDVDGSSNRNSELDFDTRSPESNRSGIEPARRASLNGSEILSVDQLEQQRKVQTTKQEVREWLSTSVSGPREAHSTRRRSKSAGPLMIGGRGGATTRLTLHTAIPDDSHIPGPGMLITEDFNDNDSMFGDQLEIDSDDDDDADSVSTAIATVEYRQEREPKLPQNETFPTLEGHPWIDAQKPQPYRMPVDPLQFANLEPSNHNDGARVQPVTAMTAIEHFLRKARDIETASWTATLGSRRRSESDMESLFSASGVSNKPSVSQARQPAVHGRKHSILNTIQSHFPKRSNSNIKKRPKPHDFPVASVAGAPFNPLVEHPSVLQDSSSGESHESSHSHLPNWVERIGRARPKSPISPLQRQGSDLSASDQQRHTGPGGRLMNALGRRRSPSDFGNISEIWRAAGGPPVVIPTPKDGEAPELPDTLAVASPNNLEVPPSGDEALRAESAESPRSAVSMSFATNTVPASAQLHDLSQHILDLNPRIPDWLQRRNATEQQRRFHRLLAARQEHNRRAHAGNCRSGRYCNIAGTGPETLSTIERSKASGNVTFLVLSQGDSSLHTHRSDPADNSVQNANFPPGIPLPPVATLPARFECPLCFQVKEFGKPSDWTKHVQEDVQPYVCTFPHCDEATSFKRKADFIRHENERHRRLESWTCQFPDCVHTCFRKDNFVQHLVREHGIPEPRSRSKTNRNQDDTIQRLLEESHRDTEKQPGDEPCHFCQNYLPSWRALNAHTAKHLEQICFPILKLVDQRAPNALPASSGASFTASTADHGPQNLGRPHGGERTNSDTSAPGLLSAGSAAVPRNGRNSAGGGTFPPPHSVRNSPTHPEASRSPQTYPPIDAVGNLSVPASHYTSYSSTSTTPSFSTGMNTSNTSSMSYYTPSYPPQNVAQSGNLRGPPMSLQASGPTYSDMIAMSPEESGAPFWDNSSMFASQYSGQQTFLHTAPQNAGPNLGEDSQSSTPSHGQWPQHQSGAQVQATASSFPLEYQVTNSNPNVSRVSPVSAYQPGNMISDYPYLNGMDGDNPDSDDSQQYATHSGHYNL